MSFSTAPLGILLTEPGIAAHGAAIRAAIEPLTAVRLIPHRTEQPLDPATLAQVQVAYITTELIGRRDEVDPEARPRAFQNELLAAPNLAWLHVCSAGTDRPAYRQLHERGVMVTHSSGANALAVAHTTVAGMLALARDVPLWVRKQQAREWYPQRHEEAPRDIDGTTVVVVGTGAIGQAIARICRAMGMRVLGVKRTAVPIDDFDAVYAQDDLDAILPQADWLVLACPLTPETRGLASARRLALLPRGARLINIGRGAVVDEAALLAALRSGHLAGAYADVFVDEPLPSDSPLWSAPNLLISAHSAGAVQGFAQRATSLFIDNLICRLRGLPLRNVATF